MRTRRTGAAGIVCIGGVILLMGVIGLRAFSREVVAEQVSPDHWLVRLVWGNLAEGYSSAIHWEKQYPFLNHKDRGAEIILREAKAKFEALQDDLEAYSSRLLPGYRTMARLSNRYEAALEGTLFQTDGKKESGSSPANSVPNPGEADVRLPVSSLEMETYLREEMAWQADGAVPVGNTGIIRLYDGQFTSGMGPVDPEKAASNAAGLRDFCSERGIDFLYVQEPLKNCTTEDPWYTSNVDYSNADADWLLAAMEERGVPYYDIRRDIHADGLSHHGMFFVTDWHWKPEAGLWAARHILIELKNRFGYDLDPDLLAPENFYAIRYPKWYLGDYGRRLTLETADPEDIDLIYPKFETKLQYIVPSKVRHRSGDFSILYSYEMVKKIDYYGSHAYSAYLGGNKAVETIINENAENDLHILILRDSLAGVTVPFMSLGVRQTDTLDLRDFTGSVETYIEKTKPDLVMIQYCPFFISQTDPATHMGMFDLR